MKLFNKLVAIIVLSTIPLTSCLIDYPKEWNLINEDNWTLVWQEDFNHNINFNYWSYAVRGKAPWRRYMTDIDTCYEIRNNALVLKGIKNTFLPEDTASYLTGGIWTRDKKTIRYGRVEIRAKINKSQGAWPAIWMIGGKLNEWPTGGEIDIVETADNEDVILQTVHTSYTMNHAFAGNPINYSSSKIPNKSEYNTYGLIINENELVFYINDRVTFIYPKIETLEEGQFPFGNEKFLILSMQLDHPPLTKMVLHEELPAEMHIDWVKFYHKIDKSLPDYNK